MAPAAEVEEDRGSAEADFMSPVCAGPASEVVAHAAPEVDVTVEVVTIFPCWPGDT